MEYLTTTKKLFHVVVVMGMSMGTAVAAAGCSSNNPAGPDTDAATNTSNDGSSGTDSTAPGMDSAVAMDSSTPGMDSAMGSDTSVPGKDSGTATDSGTDSSAATDAEVDASLLDSSLDADACQSWAGCPPC